MSRGSSQPWDQTQVSTLQVDSSPSGPPGTSCLGLGQTINQIPHCTFSKKNEFAKLIYSSSDSGYQPDSMFGNKIKGPGFGRFQSRSEEKAWHPTLVPLPGESHGRRSLVGCSPWGREESDMTERLHFHFSLSDIGEGNGNPLQCSCLENPWDGGAWWAAIYGAAQSRTRLKRLSSSSLDLRILR